MSSEKKHRQLVNHYTEMFAAKDRQEQWAIEEACRPIPKGHSGAVYEALGIMPLPDDHRLYKNAKPFVVITRGNRKKKVQE